MRISRRGFIGGTAAFAGASAAAALDVPAKGKPPRGRAPKASPMKPAKPLPPEEPPYEKADGSASDAVMCRRLYIDLAGRIPTSEEAREYAEKKDKAALISRLLAADSFADYWSMRFCDVLRVKSEFPINLWPNAVYVYHRRIRKFVERDEPWDRFARSLLTATGSDFRDAEANFTRATARRTPDGFAEAAALTFLGWEWKDLSEARRRELAGYFSCVRIKNTREWKEEIVLVEGRDRRRDFAERMLGEWRRDFAAAFVKRVEWWLLGKKEPDPARVEAFAKGGFRLRPLVRSIVESREYGRGPVKGGFRVRRLDAEVLDDALCSLMGMKRDYQSIAPEPFTFLPKDRRSILIEDGSITNAFLLLFGRPARDTGLLSERGMEVTAKQRLYLFNSGKLYFWLGRMLEGSAFKGRKMQDVVDGLYWSFFGRAPQRAERRRIMERFAALPRGKERWRFGKDVAWALLNSREFLFQH